MNKVAVLGAGSWGTALALQLARNNLNVHLWGHLKEDIHKLQQDKQNSAFLPGFEFPLNLIPSSELVDCIRDADEILIVVPSHAFSSLIDQIKPLLKSTQSISWATKGLSPQTNNLLSEVCKQQLGNDFSFAVVTGPTFALEVAEGLPTAIVIASDDEEHAQKLSAYLKDDKFRPYTSNDMIGVQVGGAAKNVMAIAAGISDGLGFGANSRAALITRGLAEITRFGVTLGGQPETFMGLAGLGDLVLTCTDNKSRNRRFGLALAAGDSIEHARKVIGQEVEGISTTREIFLKARDINVEMPITEQAYQVLFEGKSPVDAVQDLLARKTGSE